MNSTMNRVYVKGRLAWEGADLMERARVIDAIEATLRVAGHDNLTYTNRRYVVGDINYYETIIMSEDF